jgi:mannose-6-phosphate isomerase-like protein (cupin superfamily)
MLAKALENCVEFVAVDGSRVREVLHPKNDSVELRFSVAHARVPPGESSIPHRLSSVEVYHILRGHGIMHVDEESRPVRVGSCVYIPPRAIQHISNNGTEDLEFLCIVDPAWRAEDEEVLQTTVDL